ncbi:hypothetical protein FF1_042132 [Malus domestica]|uniref:Homeobox-leucine zipper protein n=1 Tax=Malus baccata TaxID=106549 RepID=A0A540KYT4_MALBA|nr:hypothetical protein C1H46_035071 [Malus baccata]
MERSKEECYEEENLDYGIEPQSAMKRKKNKSKNTRRFSDEQISLLESIFEADSKLEPRRKVQLARELGLQPRQVAIWFQNRRARWKSKQIEQELRSLREDYDKLASRFESLKEEKQSLLMQLQKLHDLVGTSRDGAPTEDSLANQTADGSSYKEGNCKTTARVRLEEALEQRGAIDSHTSHDVGGEFGDEIHDLLNIGQLDASLTPQGLHRLDSGNILVDRCNSHWLNFWT